MTLEEFFKIFKNPKILLFLKHISLTILWYLITVFLIISTVSYLVNLIWINFDIFWFKITHIFMLILLIIRTIYFLYKNNYIPKNELNDLWEQTKIWIILALEDKYDFNWFALKYDFIESLKENLDKTKFKIIILPNKFLSKVYKDKKTLDKDFILEINKKVKWHYFIWWKVEKIKNWCLKCYLNTSAMVFHDIIPDAVQTELSMDFNNLYSKDIDFSNDWYKSWIDFSWEYNSIVAKYIIWVAFLISNNPFWAIDLHRNLHIELEKIKKDENVNSSFNEKYFKLISEKIKVIQYHELSLIVNYYYSKKDNENWIKYLNEWEKLANFYWFFNANLLVQKWIYEFLINNNICESRKLIKKSASLTSDKGYKYSLVFLDLYDEKFILAKKRIREILKKKQYKWETLTVKEVINFIDDILEKYSDRIELLYWQSLLYYHKLGNIPMAYEKIEKYIKNKWVKNLEFELDNPLLMKKELERKMWIKNTRKKKMK